MDSRESLAQDLLAIAQADVLHQPAPRQPSQDTVSTHSASQLERAKYTSPDPSSASMTPPPSSQVPPAPLSRTSVRTPTPSTSQLSSPPPTSRMNSQTGGSALSFTLEQVSGATTEELQDMVSELLVALREARTSAAHHKLQYNMLCIDSAEANNRMAVELAMAQREVDVLQQTEERRRSAMPSPVQSHQEPAVSPANAALMNEMSRHLQLLQNENEELRGVFEQSQRMVERREGEIASLVEENERLRGRIRKNRDHLNGMLGEVYENQSSHPIMGAQRYPTTPRSRHRGHVVGEHRGQQAFEALLLADKMLNEKNTSAPATPTRLMPPKARFGHSRGTHSHSSMPSTPNRQTRPTQTTSALLRTPPTSNFNPAIQAPYTAPAMKQSKTRRRESTDSTISASSSEDAVMLPTKDTQIQEPQASQIASDMLRQTPPQPQQGSSSQHQAFPHVSSHQSQRVGASSAQLQGKLFGQVRKPGVSRPAEKEKRTISSVDGRAQGSASKRNRTETGVGLGIGGLSGSPTSRLI